MEWKAFDKVILFYLALVAISFVGFIITLSGFCLSNDPVETKKWWIAFMVFSNFLFLFFVLLCLACCCGQHINSEPRGFDDIIITPRRADVSVSTSASASVSTSASNVYVPNQRQPLHHDQMYFPPPPPKPERLSYPPGHRVCSV